MKKKFTLKLIIVIITLMILMTIGSAELVRILMNGTPKSGQQRGNPYERHYAFIHKDADDVWYLWEKDLQYPLS